MVSDGSLITKKVIAYAFKDLMKHQDYTKLSIKDIMTHADYRRQTFYDHFTDKDDLIQWTVAQELREVLDHFVNYEHWAEIIKHLVCYFKKNQLFYQQLFAHDQTITYQLCNAISPFVHYHVLSFAETQITQSRLYTYGLIGLLQEWLVTGCLLSEEDMTKELITPFIH